MAGRARLLMGMELARARARAGDAGALVRAGDAYERARDTGRPGEEPPPPGAAEAVWRGVGRLLAGLTAIAPGLRRALEDRLLPD